MLGRSYWVVGKPKTVVSQVLFFEGELRIIDVKILIPAFWEFNYGSINLLEEFHGERKSSIEKLSGI